MRLRSFIAGTIFPAAFVLGCASTPDTGIDSAAADGASVITVVNNHSSAREMIIYLEPQGRGERQVLGSVAPGQTRAFSHPVAGGYYRLSAEHEAGTFESGTFNVQTASNVRWVLNSDRVTVSSR